MGRTKAQHHGLPLCGAKKKNGKPCRALAGMGTKHPGIGTCKHHFGNAPNHVKHAVKEAVKKHQRSFGEPKKVMPGDALMEMLWTAYGQVHWLAGEIDKQKDLTSFEARVLVQAHAEERDRVAKIATTALAAGVAERRVRLAELYGELIATLISGVLDDMKLSPAQKRHVPSVVRGHLLALDGGREELPVLGPPPDVEGKAKRVVGR
jgi:hypothetical protein